MKPSRSLLWALDGLALISLVGLVFALPEGGGCLNCRVMAGRGLWYLFALPAGLPAAVLASVVALRERRWQAALAPVVAMGVIAACFLGSLVASGRPIPHGSPWEVVAALAGFAWWALTFAMAAARRPFGVGDVPALRGFRLIQAANVLGFLFVGMGFWLQVDSDFELWRLLRG